MRETRSQLSVFEVIPGTDQVSPTCPGVPCGPRSVPHWRREAGCAGRGARALLITVRYCTGW